MRIFIKAKRKDNKYPVLFRFSNGVARNKLFTLAQVKHIPAEYPDAKIEGMPLNINPKKRAAKKKTAKRTVKKKAAKKTARRTNPAYKESVVVAQLRPEKAREATRKRLNIVNRLYYDGAGWSEKIVNAARFRSRAHAVRIAKLIVESKIHNNALRQIGVTEAVESRGKQRGAA